MARFVALLRGINVSGHRQIAMADLRRSLQAAGLRDARTYLQSGNAVFEADEDDPEVVAAAIHTRIAADVGHQVEALVLPCAAVVRIASSNPFASSPGADERWFHATFLFHPASEAAFAELRLPAGQGELAMLADGVVFLYLPNGYGRTKLNNAYFERALGTPATTRNWRTVLALAGLCAPGDEGDGALRGAAASPPAADAPPPEAAARREPRSPA
jgi:uncharacterized protein (DUF1697 family)